MGAGKSQLQHCCSTETPMHAYIALNDEFCFTQGRSLTSTVCYGHSDPEKTTTPSVRLGCSQDVANCSMIYEPPQPCFVRAFGFAYVLGTLDSNVCDGADDVVIVRTLYPAVATASSSSASLWRIHAADIVPLAAHNLVTGVNVHSSASWVRTNAATHALAFASSVVITTIPETVAAALQTVAALQLRRTAATATQRDKHRRLPCETFVTMADGTVATLGMLSPGMQQRINYIFCNQ